MKMLKYRSLFFVILLAACNQMESTAEEEVSGNMPENNTQEYALTAAQRELAGIKVGQLSERKMFREIRCTGLAELPPQNIISVHSPVKGFVGKVPQIIGDFVKKGALLTTVSHPELLHMQRQLLESKQLLAMLEKDYNRQRVLAQSDAASQAVFEKAEAEFELEKVRYQGYKAELQAININVEELEQTQELQPNIRIYAPGQGYVNQIEINPGKLVQPEDLMYQVLDVSHMHLELNVLAKDIGWVKEEQRVDVVLPGTNKKFEAHVHRLGRGVDLESKTARIHAHFDEGHGILPGTFIQATIYTEERTVLALPEGAVVREGDKHFVFVQSGDQFQKQLVQAGHQEDGFIELIDGEALIGKQVVVEGAYYINSGGE